jgi:single-strand DNA-binding protein
MARDLNLWQGIGRLGKDPEVRHLESGNSVCNFSVACNDDYKDKNSGELVKKTEWVNVVVWGKLAEICGQWLTKGSQVYLSGKLTTRKWTDKEGNTRYSTEVNVSDMQMLGGNQRAGGEGHDEPSEPRAKQAPKDEKPFEDDIPF